MEPTENEIMDKRVCKICLLPLSDDVHGNKKSHDECAYKEKKKRQREKYRVGNDAKLMIQKNEAVAATLYRQDKPKQGIPYMLVSESGFKFSCPTSKRTHFNKIINMMDRYGYSLETVNGEVLIFFYHVSELL